MAEGSNRKRGSAEHPYSSAANDAQPVESKLGDFGKGSREESQGGAKPDEEWQEKLAPVLSGRESEKGGRTSVKGPGRGRS